MYWCRCEHCFVAAGSSKTDEYGISFVDEEDLIIRYLLFNQIKNIFKCIILPTQILKSFHPPLYIHPSQMAWIFLFPSGTINKASGKSPWHGFLTFAVNYDIINLSKKCVKPLALAMGSVKRNHATDAKGLVLIMDQYSDLFLKAMALWCELTGVAFDQSHFTGMSAVMTHIQNRRVKKAVEVDPTGYLPLMILGIELRKWLESRTASLLRVLTDDSVSRNIGIAREIMAIVEDPSVTMRLAEERERFTKILQMIKKQKAIATSANDEQGVQETKSVSDDMFVELLFEAKTAGETLRVDQFRRGEKTKRAPVLADTVFESDSVSAFVRALASAKEYESAVVMCLIRDADEPLFSFFAMGIRLGERVYLVSDKPTSAHPLYKHRTRRPGRSQAERMEELCFPYYLMDFDVDGRGDLYLGRGNPDSDMGLKKLTPVADMHHANILWYIMLYQSLVEKFYLADFEADELSYTGDMIKIQPNHGTEALVLSDGGQTLLSIASGQELRVAMETEANFIWPLANMSQTYLNFPIEVEPSAIVPVASGTRETTITHGNLSAKGFTFGQDSFGTQKELTEDLLFIARHNEAALVQAQLDQNKVETKRRLSEWYIDRVYANREFLFKAIANEVLLAQVETHSSGSPFGAEVVAANILRLEEIRKDANYNHFGGYQPIIAPGVTSFEYAEHCLVNGAKPSHVALFRVETEDVLALMTGIQKEDLPPELKGFRRNGVYSGNSILDRVDPMECIKNPYYKIYFNISIFLSKSGLKALMKKYRKTDV